MSGFVRPRGVALVLSLASGCGVHTSAVGHGESAGDEAMDTGTDTGGADELPCWDSQPTRLSETMGGVSHADAFMVAGSGTAVVWDGAELSFHRVYGSGYMSGSLDRLVRFFDAWQTWDGERWVEVVSAPPVQAGGSLRGSTPGGETWVFGGPGQGASEPQLWRFTAEGWEQRDVPEDWAYATAAAFAEDRRWLVGLDEVAEQVEDGPWQRSSWEDWGPGLDALRPDILSFPITMQASAGGSIYALGRDVVARRDPAGQWTWAALEPDLHVRLTVAGEHAVMRSPVEPVLLRWDGSGEPEAYALDPELGVVFGRDEVFAIHATGVDRLSFGSTLTATPVFAFEPIPFGRGVAPTPRAGWEVTGEGLLRWEALTPELVEAGAFVDLWLDANEDGWAIGVGDEGTTLWRVEAGVPALGSSQLPAQIELRAVWGRASDDVWAVGARRLPAEPEPRGVLFRFDGEVWTEQLGPSRDARAFIEITGTDDGRVLVVQDSLADADAEIQAFDGETWTSLSYVNATASLEQAQLVAAGEVLLLHVGPGDDRFYTRDEVGWDYALDTWPELPRRVLGLSEDGEGGAWAASTDALWHFDGATWTETALANGIRTQAGLGVVVTPEGVLLRETVDADAPGSSSAHAWSYRRACLD